MILLVCCMKNISLFLSHWETKDWHRTPSMPEYSSWWNLEMCHWGRYPEEWVSDMFNIKTVATIIVIVVLWICVNCEARYSVKTSHVYKNIYLTQTMEFFSCNICASIFLTVMLFLCWKVTCYNWSWNIKISGPGVKYLHAIKMYANEGRLIVYANEVCIWTSWMGW
jgi:hypothetical protein